MHLYIVHYGTNTSAQWFAAHFIKHCIDSGTRIREVEKSNGWPK